MTITPPAALGQDITECDREPIHIPGSIQPHGLLLVADAATLTVVAGAGDIEGRLSADWLGQDLSALLDQDIAALLGDGAGSIAASIAASIAGRIEGRARGRDEDFTLAIHRSGESVLVELEPVATDMPWGNGTVLGWLDVAAGEFERAVDLQALCERAATVFRTLTGYDRVMLYRFLDDEAGRVVAEDRAPGLGTFLHHHFPASDIPKQARALYIRNRARAIPDIAYTPAPLRPAGFETLDLSDVALRSVSPIHIQYLHNMDVAASASISIVKDGVLWGLIACHNDTPRALAADVRTAASVLAAGLARQIRTKEDAEAYRERIRLRTAEDSVVARLGGHSDLRQAVADAADEMQALLGGDGFAFVAGSVVDRYGHCPSELDVIDLADWAKGRGDTFATRELSTVFSDARAYRDTASGLLAVPLRDEGVVLLWFRPEQVEDVEWAGNPHKAVAGPGGALTPRASFASWTQEVRGRSRRWTLEEVETAHRLRRTMHDAHRNQRLRTLNADLQRTLADKEAALAQKDVLMKEVDHRVQNSLQLVSAFLALQARQHPHIADHLGEAQARLSAVALVHRRLYRDDQIETIDLSRYLGELAGDMKTSFGAEWGQAMRVDLSPVLIPTDRAVNVGLIMTELIINATKYAYGGAAGPIAITLEQHRNRLRLIVADQGRGKTGDGQGFGSRMMAAMIAKLGGTLDHQDNRPGLRAIVTAPIEEAR